MPQNDAVNKALADAKAALAHSQKAFPSKPAAPAAPAAKPKPQAAKPAAWTPKPGFEDVPMNELHGQSRELYADPPKDDAAWDAVAEHWKQ